MFLWLFLSKFVWICFIVEELVLLDDMEVIVLFCELKLLVGGKSVLLLDVGVVIFGVRMFFVVFLIVGLFLRVLLCLMKIWRIFYSRRCLMLCLVFRDNLELKEIFGSFFFKDLILVDN